MISLEAYKRKKRVYDYAGKKWVRKGRCYPNRCGGACCRFIVIPASHSKYKGEENYDTMFGEVIKVKDRDGLKDKKVVRIPVVCKHLNRANNRCLVHNGKQPTACKQFPHIYDEVYQAVKDVCTYRFEEVEEQESK